MPKLQELGLAEILQEMADRISEDLAEQYRQVGFQLLVLEPPITYPMLIKIIMIVRDYLEKQAKERPTKPAILFKEEKITFSELNILSNRVANRFLKVTSSR
jgi:hypothetical protein